MKTCEADFSAADGPVPEGLLLTNIWNLRCELMKAPSLTPMCARDAEPLSETKRQCEREALSMNKEKRHPQEGQHSADAIAAGPGTECSRETG